MYQSVVKLVLARLFLSCHFFHAVDVTRCCPQTTHKQVYAAKVFNHNTKVVQANLLAYVCLIPLEYSEQFLLINKHCEFYYGVGQNTQDAECMRNIIYNDSAVFYWRRMKNSPIALLDVPMIA